MKLSNKKKIQIHAPKKVFKIIHTKPFNEINEDKKILPEPVWIPAHNNYMIHPLVEYYVPVLTPVLSNTCVINPVMYPFAQSTQQTFLSYCYR